MHFITDLENDLRQNANRELAVPMEHYMKDHFVYLGIKTENRRAIFKSNCKKHQSEIKSNFRTIAWELFAKKEREFHYCGIEILMKEINHNYLVSDIILIEKFITTHSWWDSVDVISKYILGGYLHQFPNEVLAVIERFSNSQNMWLHRSTILFQLSYKEKTNFDLLKAVCEKHKHSKEFFIQKAIGWALRDYSKYNSSGVMNYVNTTNLKPLSRREALRNIS